MPRHRNNRLFRLTYDAVYYNRGSKIMAKLLLVLAVLLLVALVLLIPSMAGQFSFF